MSATLSVLMNMKWLREFYALLKLELRNNY